jgi:hypothetical protein
VSELVLEIPTKAELEAMSDDALVSGFRLNAASLPLTWARGLAFADEIARRNGERQDRAHAAYHKRETLNYGRVERRRGYRGHTTCLDCYRGRPWDGSGFEALRV